MRLLALDVGERRIGVALSDSSGTLARPLLTLERASQTEDFAAIGALVSEHDVKTVVVGHPVTLRGEEGPQAQWVAGFADGLAEALPVPVEFWDERWTTVEAEEIMRETRKRKGRRSRGKPDVDAVAAAVILQSYLDCQACPSTGLHEEES